ncbi:MAG: hypothetical protein D6748_01265 [Calditrichaeota bacterium]|nr:MAG: hypothetical protein D6748_01265 [Calditrichota bacterium]
MSKLPFKFTMLVFLIALLTGFYLRLPLMDNFIRAFVIYLIFSVLILLIFLIYNQSTYSMLRAQMEHQKNGHRKSVLKQSTSKTE